MRDLGYIVAGSLLFYIVLTILAAFNVEVPQRWPNALLAVACMAVAFWLGPKFGGHRSR